MKITTPKQHIEGKRYFSQIGRKKTPIWLIYKEYFSQIELKNIDLAKVSFAFSNNYRIFAP